MSHHNSNHSTLIHEYPKKIIEFHKIHFHDQNLELVHKHCLTRMLTKTERSDDKTERGFGILRTCFVFLFHSSCFPATVRYIYVCSCIPTTLWPTFPLWNTPIRPMSPYWNTTMKAQFEYNKNYLLTHTYKQIRFNAEELQQTSVFFQKTVFISCLWLWN